MLCDSRGIFYAHWARDEKKPDAVWRQAFWASREKRKDTPFGVSFMAEKERFELSKPLPVYMISNHAPSTN